ncbi:hypothetical protein [Mycolicibacter sinensis]|nr:hypothetical protein [Mycolicibacter sinensis]
MSCTTHSVALATLLSAIRRAISSAPIKPASASAITVTKISTRASGSRSTEADRARVGGASITVVGATVVTVPATGTALPS